MKFEIKGWMVDLSIGLAGFGVGVCTGYFIAKHQLTEKALEDSNNHLEQLRSEQLELDFKRAEMDKTFNKQVGQAYVLIEDLKEIREARIDKMAKDMHESNASVESHPSNREPIIIRRDPTKPVSEDNILINIFPNENDDWDYDEEVKHRTPDHPYIIHRDEYFSNEMDYRQSTLTFYEGDSILCDELDVPVYNPEKIVGKLIFGHGSQDISICYVRNEHLEAEYEVLLDHGFFQTEVLGETIVKPDIKHSHRVPKFKRD